MYSAIVSYLRISLEGRYPGSVSFFHLRDRDFRVYVRKDAWGDKEKLCDWLGRDTYKCGNCLKGYPKVNRAMEHEEKCEACGWLIFARYSSD